MSGGLCLERRSSWDLGVMVLWWWWVLLGLLGREKWLFWRGLGHVMFGCVLCGTWVGGVVRGCMRGLICVVFIFTK